MKVSVIMVSYNMCKLLRQSLAALRRSVQNIDAEIILVDNNSDDYTVETISKEFPEVKISTSNGGLSHCVNQGISIAKGEYLLFLSPDALTKKETISKALQFMEGHTAAGGLSVRMLDVDGNYMQASKKTVPRRWVTLLKLTGLLKQFSKSRLTEHYIDRHDDEFDTTETDVMHDRFMLIRKSVMDNVGPLDERFNRYGGNIDLSYRIRLAGFRNYYFPKTYIINLQYNRSGKFSWNNLKSFYGAMFIFAVKYIFRLPALSVKPAQELYPAYELKG
jgi:GT2 family glycosyltransferase